MSTSQVISKDEIDTCTPWELDIFDTTKQSESEAESENNLTEDEQTITSEESAEDKKIEDAEENAVEDTEESIVAVDEEKVELLYQQAKEDGHSEGYQAGHTAGYEAGRKESEQEIKAEIAQLQQLIENLNQQLRSVDQEIAENLLAVALELAKKMITQALKINPDFILPIVQEALRHLPSSTHPPTITLHPDDAKIIRQHLNKSDSSDLWEITEDVSLAIGGCHIEVNGSTVDATIESRWRKTLSSIGNEDNWLATEDQHDAQ